MRITLSLLALACLLVCRSATAQSTYPQMAYTEPSGKSLSVYVSNLDGSRAVKVATGVGNVHGLDLSPQPGKLAFSDSEGLKVVSFTTTSNSLQVLGVQLRVPGAFVTSPDFTADGSGLLYYLGSNGPNPSSFQLVPVGPGPSVMLCQCAGSNPRWLAPTVDGDRFIFQRMFASPTRAELWSGLIAADGTVSIQLELATISQSFYEIPDFDVSHTRNAVLLSANYGEAAGARIIEYNLDTDVITQLGARGQRVHYSSGDAKVVYITPHAASGDYVNVLDTSTGVSAHVTKKGTYGITDARP